MTLSQLTTRCGYWADRLNLREWSIKVQFGSKRSIHRGLGFDAYGCIEWDTEALTAAITLQRGCKDQESTLVHELLHLVLEGHGEVKDHDANTERAINRIAAALVNAQ